MAVAIEDAGMEIRDTLQWLYGSGFPKSHDVSKAIDKMAGAEREVIGIKVSPDGRDFTKEPAKVAGGKSWAEGAGFRDTLEKRLITAPATPEAEQWQGWGTALKPSYEPVICARKPLTDVPLSPIIQADMTDLLGGLICLSVSFASNAEPSSASSPSVHAEASVSALMLAAVHHGQLSADSSAPMGTFRSPETASTFLSIAASWSSILDVCSTHGSTFTTSTATSLTTALKTLSCLLSGIIPACIIKDVSRPVGSLLSASTADNPSSGDETKPTHTLSAIAAALATWQHGSAFTDAKSAGLISPATIQSVDSVLKRVLTELRTVSDSASHLTPNHEPIIMARKPFKGTVAANVLAHGTGAINVDACRIGYQSDEDKAKALAGDAFKRKDFSDKGAWARPWMHDEEKVAAMNAASKERAQAGRWPANVILDEEVAEGHEWSRFFYVAKASRRERNAGLEGMPERINGRNQSQFDGGAMLTGSGNPRSAGMANHHPTVKPLALMRYLIQMVTPPDGIVLDPFMGSGSTLVAAAELGFHAIGIEMNEEYAEIAARRVDHALNERARRLPGLETAS